MRVTNNIHNIASLDESEFVQEWTEEEKIPIKASPVTPPPPKKEESQAKEGDGGAAEEKKEETPPEPVKQPEQ